ncbi:hypothetical protein [Paractinoplanes atraurantiacus]|uniref:hypothetical protein n=1 Tax=Paractinoplanes atraurantiacus TaxID=1036182 RepID=UPI00117829BE|nr:hypothetical protein [Actinoplanes atraurantiacus]
MINLQGEPVIRMLFSLRLSFSGKAVHRIFSSAALNPILEELTGTNPTLSKAEANAPPPVSTASDTLASPGGSTSTCVCSAPTRSDAGSYLVYRRGRTSPARRRRTKGPGRLVDLWRRRGVRAVVLARGSERGIRL